MLAALGVPQPGANQRCRHTFIHAKPSKIATQPQNRVFLPCVVYAWHCQRPNASTQFDHDRHQTSAPRQIVPEFFRASTDGCQGWRHMAKSAWLVT
jgi:hypothetical protein